MVKTKHKKAKKKKNQVGMKHSIWQIGTEDKSHGNLCLWRATGFPHQDTAVQFHRTKQERTENTTSLTGQAST